MSAAHPAILEADWPVPPGVRAFTTLRRGAGVSPPPFDAFNLGTRCGDDPRAAQANRNELATRFGLPSAPRWLRQVHGTGVLRFDPPVAGAPPGRDPMPDDAGRAEASLLHEPEADAATTCTPGVVLAILTADCLPVVFAADDGSEVAAAHAGWRGLSAGVLEATVRAMRTPPQRLLAWLGPAAGAQAYEVGTEVFDTFIAGDARDAGAFRPTRPGHWHVDLYALARRRLADAGIGRVHGGGLCTISDPRRFYSHRRSAADGSGRTGRMATLAWIAP